MNSIQLPLSKKQARALIDILRVRKEREDMTCYEEKKWNSKLRIYEWIPDEEAREHQRKTIKLCNLLIKKLEKQLK